MKALFALKTWEKPLIKKLATLSLLGAALLAGCAHPQPMYVSPLPPPAAAFEQGVHDGFEAARHDVATGRPPNFAHHPRFRNPPVPPPAVPDYRRGFRQGYDQFLHQGAPPPPPPPAY